MEVARIVVFAVLAVIVIGGVAVALRKRNRSTALREHFGPEYERLMRERGDPRAAEAELLNRKHRFARFHLRALDADQRRQFAQRWQMAQAHFVDDPRGAVTDAQSLVEETMVARGYPLGDWDQREADVSVERPDVVANFRAARDIARRNARGLASTEDLRKAMVHYRALFEGLLEGRKESVQPPLEAPPSPSEAPRMWSTER
jgi:hypothetical protein